MNALIIVYNRLTLPKNMVEYLASCGINPIIIDNNSDYPPLLEYYKTTPYQVVRMEANFGHKVVWEQNVLGRLGIEGRYIVTDPDLDLSQIPKDFLAVLEEGLNRYPQFDKCGFSLEVNDVPDSAREIDYWNKPLDAMYFDAPIDTTFALYRHDYFAFWGIRTNRPYTARHVPWYYDNINDLPEDEQYYFKTCGPSSSGAWRIKR